MRYPRLAQASLPPRPGQPPRPVPERVGEPSVFKHVVYIIKENRTYDQVLGDMKEGNGDPALCVFGERITPNQHKLAREFVLLDNTYCSGILSADGHQWADTALATDYMEKSFAGFPRSYPGRHGRRRRGRAGLFARPGSSGTTPSRTARRLRDYGEFAITRKSLEGQIGAKASPKFLDHYREFVNGTGHDQPPQSSRPSSRCARTWPPTPWAGTWQSRTCSARRSSSGN